MRGTSPPPIVPEMPTTDETTTGADTLTSDGGESGDTRRASSELSSDGGERRSLPERAFGAPLVPDCS